jgi:hypothetical protein
LDGVQLEAHGCRGREVTHAHVDEPGAIRQLDPQETVRAGRDRLAGEAYAHAPCERLHSVAERREDVHEKGVLLEAIPAAPQHDELPLDRLRVEQDGATQQDVEVLERNAAGVRADQRVQRHEVGCRRATVADAVEVSVEVGGEAHGGART